MLTNLKVITPSTEHSKELCDLLIESITMNCAADYNNDPQIMKEWLINKTPENISQWISSTNNISLVAIDTLKDKLSGFALMNKDGEILLNYVLPSHIYKGVGKVLLKEMEHIAKSSGIQALSVVSTITAKNFYERNGFVKNGEPEYVGVILGDFPLIKHLNTA
ncbi:GNAT family N-acetyltransferase [Legionella worsleiensis]|uniref:Putative acyltransferase n=1 Tax=Legionella worsleiensis TaxID=45076 RepID=A0A0W1AE84_9GAMM|nr:GNAT family N-acetyltransferase [Legionella worsleiensis]KTD79642.1 putative acyltransferase [Legionella worsleiensis]STY32152.1 N-acetyltransferase GCN5 [Legionella worsleiensis]